MVAVETGVGDVGGHLGKAVNNSQGDDTSNYSGKGCELTGF